MAQGYEERCAASGLPIAKGDRVVVTLLDATPEFAMPDRPGAIGIGLPFECAYDGDGWFEDASTGYPNNANLGALANAAEHLVMPSGDTSPAGEWETFSAMARERQEREVETHMGVMVVRADVFALMVRDGTPDDARVDARAFTLGRVLMGCLAALREGLRGRGRPGPGASLVEVDGGRLTTQFLAWLAQNPERLGPEGNDADLAEMVVDADAFERAADLLGIELTPSLRLRAGVDWDRVRRFQESAASLSHDVVPSP